MFFCFCYKKENIYIDSPVKISYSTTKNMRSIITSNNNKLLKPLNNGNNPRECNCVPASSCPVDNKCLKSSLVYSCKVESNSESKAYIGVTKNSFKERWNAHQHYHRHIEERHRTTLANYIWSLKERNIPFSENWSIETHGQTYSPEIGYCNACSIEKYFIFKYFRTRNLTNRRHELCFKCVHAKQFLLTNNRTWVGLFIGGSPDEPKLFFKNIFSSDGKNISRPLKYLQK